MSFSAYVHVPYCLRRCGYCDFNTYANLGLGPGVSGYADAVGREIALVARLYPQLHPVDTVFFGGGTPTVLPPEDLVQIFYALKSAFGVRPGAEITTEANPDTVDAGYLEELAAYGFTRVSFGMQSAVSSVLRVLDRTHTQANLEAAVCAAQDLGLECSVDLIYGTPGESMADWRESLEAALALGVNHVSCYALSIEENTALGRALAHGQIAPVDPDDQAEKYELADRMLGAAGLQWYEISNWARPGHECRHNLAYWRNRDYYGFGPGAHSHLSGKHWERGRAPAGEFLGENSQECGRGRAPAGDFPPAGGRRFWNLKHPARWAGAVDAGRLPIEDGETVTGESLELEDLLLGLRLREGLDLREYARKFGSNATVDTGESRQSATSAGLRLAPHEQEADPGNAGSGEADPGDLGGEQAPARGQRAGFRLAPHEFETKLLAEARQLAAEGLLEPASLGDGDSGGKNPRGSNPSKAPSAGSPGESPRAVLTRRGRLLADTVIQRLAGVS